VNTQAISVIEFTVISVIKTHFLFSEAYYRLWIIQILFRLIRVRSLIMPKVSVIVPVRNAEKYIKQCITSILSQTLEDLDVIIIDDGSTDRTGNIVDETCKNDQRVRVFHQDNKGLYATRGIGLKMAKGEYVGWVDADDFLDPTMYEVLYNAALLHESDICYCDYNWYPDKSKLKEKWFRVYNGEKNVDYVERNSQPWNKIVRRDLLERLNIAEKFERCFDEIYIEILLEAKNPISVEKKLYNYRIAPGTMSGSYNNVKHYEAFVKSSEELKSDAMRTLQLTNYWIEYFDYRIVYYTIITMIVAAFNDDKERFYFYKRRLMIRKPFYIKNQHFLHVMVRNNGYLKATIMGIIVPNNFYLTKLMSKLALK